MRATSIALTGALIFSGSAAGLIEGPYYDYAIDSGGLTADRVRSLWDRVALLEKARAALGADADADGGRVRRGAGVQPPAQRSCVVRGHV